MDENARSVWTESATATPEMAALRAALTTAERRAATLAELTSLMNEGKDALALAQRAVELTARSMRAGGAFVYLWDRDENRLVLQVATDGWQHRHLGRIKLRLGEGVTGWTALMRQTVVIPNDPTADPRFKLFPELKENAFKSMVAVPIVAPGQDVLGVFSLYATHRDGFTAPDVSLATEVGALLASGLVQAETLAQLRVHSAATRFLRDLPEEAWGSPQQCVTAMAVQCLTDLAAEACLIEVSVGTPTNAAATTKQFDELHPDMSPQNSDRVARLRAVDASTMSRMRIPLATSAPIGAITCYRSRRFTSDDELLLDALSAQIAAGILSLMGSERVQPVVDQVLRAPDEASTERLLRRHRWRPRPGWVAVVKVMSHPRQAAGHDAERAALVEVLGRSGRPFTLLGDAGTYVVVAEAVREDQREAFVTELSELPQRMAARLIAGVGPFDDLGTDTHRGVRQASAALRWAELMPPAPAVIIAHERIAHLRLLPRVALEMSDALAKLAADMGAVVQYDLANSTDLALTLDTYLANSGSVAKTSAELFIHRNTLRQRVQRIEELLGQPPEEFIDWVAAGLAARMLTEQESELKERGRSEGTHSAPA